MSLMPEGPNHQIRTTTRNSPKTDRLFSRNFNKKLKLGKETQSLRLRGTFKFKKKTLFLFLVL